MLGIPRAEAELLLSRVKQIDPNLLSVQQLLQCLLRLRSQGIDEITTQMAFARKVFSFIKSHKEGVSLAMIRKEFEELAGSHGIIGFLEPFGFKVRTKGFKADMVYFV